jgi:hypothetical protein
MWLVFSSFGFTSETLLSLVISLPYFILSVSFTDASFGTQERVRHYFEMRRDWNSE